MQSAVTYDQGPRPEKQLERIDSLRHDLVHEDLFGKPIPTILKDLDFLEELGWYFFVIVHERFYAKLVSTTRLVPH